ncbi:MAG: hypothetical protein DWQ10_04755, partial [Calditrichaeota bacterium]
MFTTSTNILERLFNQPGKIPKAVEEQILAKTGDEKIRLYALCDLDSGKKFTAYWIALTNSSFVIYNDEAAV